MSSDAEAAVIHLEAWDGTWDGDDAFADLKSDVVAHAKLDPLATLAGLAASSGIPVGALARYVLTRWAAGGSEGLLELGTSGVDHLVRIIERAETDGSDLARLEAYEGVRDVVAWLRAGADPPQDATAR